MRKSQFAGILTEKQLHSLLEKIDFPNPVFVASEEAPPLLTKFYEISIVGTHNDEIICTYFKSNGKFYLMLYSDFYFTIYQIITLKDLTQEVIVVPHDSKMFKLMWDHFLYTIFKKDYEVFWWSERFISRDKLIESTKARIHEFDVEANKAIERIKKGVY